MRTSRAAFASAGWALAIGASLGLGCADDAVKAPDAAIAGDAADAASSGAPDAARSDDAALVLDAGASDIGTNPDLDAGPESPNDPAISRISVGTVSVAAGVSPPISFELPDDVASFMVTLQGPKDVLLIISRLEGPTGLLVDDQGEGGRAEPFMAQFASANRVTQKDETATGMFPNNPNVTVSGGSYSIAVGAFSAEGFRLAPADAEVSITVHYRKRSSAQSRLDLHLYFTGAGGLRADNAASDPLMQEALTRFTAIYGAAGIEIGTIAYHDVDEAYQTVEPALLTSGRLGDLFRETRSQSGGLHFFFIERFESPLPFLMVGGIAGGIPGPAGLRGSNASGVAVALEPAAGDAAIVAHVMAHEGGHWLGLFHTQEVQRGIEDQHPETPTGTEGQRYLMYPTTGSGAEISPSQATVMREHAEVIAE